MNTGKTVERIDIGADVIGSTGDKVGTVGYVVVQPPEMHVTDIVVSTGAILGRDVVVPVDKIEEVADGKVHLTIDQEELGQCPDYVEVQYQAPPANWAPATGFMYPDGAMLSPVGTAYPEVSSVTVNAPAGTVGLHHGMDVESSDGHKVGTVDALDADAKTGDVTAFIVKHGLLFSQDTRIPVSHVSSVEEDRVQLDLTKEQVEDEFERRGDDA